MKKPSFLTEQWATRWAFFVAMESRVFCGIGRVNHANKLAKDKDAHKEPTTTPVVRTNDSFCF